MISDIRKELRLKRDLMKFKRQIISACQETDTRPTPKSQSLKKSKTSRFFGSSKGDESSLLSDERMLNDSNRKELKHQLSLMDEQLR